jgi:hypothetical protein
MKLDDMSRKLPSSTMAPQSERASLFSYFRFQIFRF